MGREGYPAYQSGAGLPPFATQAQALVAQTIRAPPQPPDPGAAEVAGLNPVRGTFDN